jgi:mono/diheme cytochrome c family protein
MQNKYMHRKLTFVVVLFTATLLAGCHSTPPPKPLGELTVPEVRGYSVYQAHCAVCHYDRVAKALHGPPLLGVFKKPYLPSGAPANDERVSATVLHGRNLMPAQPQMDPKELADLLSYLHTL